MTSESKRVYGLFLAALEASGQEAREAMLRRECGSEPEIFQQVNALLRAHWELKGDYDPIAHTTPFDKPSSPTSVSEKLERITIGDRFRILDQIGEGGMGMVWVAEQLKPVRRQVAIKVIKPGMDSRQVLARFEAERQALAMMDHPNIAKVFDGGMTDQGNPYFVMEYVKGIPITSYCDRARLTLAERLQLFVLVCQAVQHAHQKGIIHRDLKPSNILVCLQEGQPVPKVIDFGLAKAMHQPLTEHTMYTLHGVMVGTPLYMSPEQAARDKLDVDTRTDIYSLGVILYELLTGTTPLERERIQQAAHAEVLRSIKEDEPPKPSTRIESSAYLPSLASQRNIEPTKLLRSIKGDLDWIVMKALDKDRGRRYETANGLARDIQRFMNEEPVEACPPTVRYRLSKLARRHCGLLITASAFALVLILGATFSAWQAIRATIASREARTNEQRARIAAAAETKERHRAEEAEAHAVQIAKMESEARAEAELRERSERWERYRANIASAASSHQTDNQELVRKNLEIAPEEHRNWEWHYFFHQLDNKQKEIPNCLVLSKTGGIVVRRESPTDAVIHFLAVESPPLVLRHSGNVIGGWLFSDDSRLAIATDAPGMHIWDVRSGNEIAKTACEGAVSSFVFSPKGDRLLLGCESLHKWYGWSYGESHAPIYMAEFGDPAATVRPQFNASGERLSGGHGEHASSLLDANTLESIATLPGPAHGFSPDGEKCVTYSDGSIFIFDSRKGERLAEIKNIPQIVNIVWSPDSQRILTNANFPSNLACLLDVVHGREISRLVGHTNQIWHVAFSADGRRAVTSSLDQTARVWDGQTGSLISVLRGHRATLLEAVFSPDGGRVVTIANEPARKLWNAETGEFICSLVEPFSGNSILHMGDTIATIHSHGSPYHLTMWNAQQIEQNGVLQGHTSYIYDVVFRQDGQEVASASWDGSIRTWDVATGQVKRVFQPNGPGYFRSVAYSPDGRQLVGADVFEGKGRVTLWDADTQGILSTWEFPGDTEDFRAIFDPSGKSVISGCTDGSVLLLKANQERATLVGSIAQRNNSSSRYPLTTADVAFSPDKRRFASGNFDHAVAVWDAQSREGIATLWGHGGPVLRVVYSPNGSLLATASTDGTVRLWDTNTHQASGVLDHGTAVYGLSFTPDGTRLATGCADGLIRLWDVPRRSLVAELRGHKDYVHAVHFNSDGTRLVSGSGDLTVRLWDTVPMRVRSRSPETFVAPKGYLCFRTPAADNAITVDGKLDEPAWQAAPWTDAFVDIEGDWKPRPRFRTREKMLWDDEYFYIAAELEEPHLQGTFTKHDSYIFHQDNDFEVFFDPDGDGHNYGEYEMNALNTGWDLRLTKPYKNGGQAEDSWEIPGLKSAVYLDGTLNKPEDTDRRWTIELAFPWSVLGQLVERRDVDPKDNGRQNRGTSTASLSPHDGDQWRINFSRVEWQYDVERGEYRKVANRKEDNWVWSPQGTINMHRPETWGYVQFSSAITGSPEAELVKFHPDPAGPAKHILHRIQYAEADFYAQNKRWAKTLDELRLDGLTHPSLRSPPDIEVAGDHFEASVEVNVSEVESATWCIREDAKIWRKK